MKSLITLIAICVSVFYCSAQGIKFIKPANWAEVLRQAKTENRYIFIDVYATWCKPCKMMDTDVYSNASVGKIINSKFISVKIQTDQSAEDEFYTISWYKEAAELTSKYKLNALPALLFLSPDGELLFRSEGYQTPKKFIGLALFAIDPESQAFHSRVDDYKKGKKNLKELPELAGVVYKVMLNDSLSTAMLKDYFDNYVNKLTRREDILTHKNLSVAISNTWLVSATNKLIKELLKYPASFSDSLMGWPGGTVTLLSDIIRKDELDWKLCPGGKMLNPNPDWKKLEKDIAKKYPQVDVAKVIEEFQVSGSAINGTGFWYRTKNWPRINQYYTNMVTEALEKKDWGLINTICWFIYYIQITDRPSLELAARWIETCIEMVPSDTTISKFDYANLYLDTKACILYKLGRRQEAIATEEKALKIAQDFNLASNQPRDKSCMSFLINIDKMKAGEKIIKVVGGPAIYPDDWKLFD